MTKKEMRMWALTAKVWKAIKDTPPAFPVKNVYHLRPNQLATWLIEQKGGSNDRS